MLASSRSETACRSMPSMSHNVTFLLAVLALGGCPSQICKITYGHPKMRLIAWKVIKADPKANPTPHEAEPR